MNPELERNLWLDTTKRRLAFAGAVLGGVFLAVWVLDRGRHAYAVTLAGAGVYFAAALAWGPRLARASVMQEAVQGTWDAQRLSTLEPWEMAWGKLAGSTARAWVFAMGGLGVAALQLASTSSLRHAAFWVLVALALGVTLQAAGLATGLLDVRRARAVGRPLSARAPGLLLMALTLLTVAVLVWARARVGAALTRLEVGGAPAQVLWFGRAFEPVAFAAASLMLFAAWALVWAWRLMRLELQLASRPWAWAGFVAFAALYVAGFAPLGEAAASALAGRLAAVSTTLAALAYLAAFAEPADRVRARQFAAALRAGTGRALAHLPLLAPPAALALGTGAALAAMRASEDDGAAAVQVLAALAFFVRDLGVIAWRRFSPRGGGDAGVIVTLLLLYVLGAGLGRLFGGETGQALFTPSAARPLVSVSAAVVEAAAAWALAGLNIARPARPRRRFTAPSTRAPFQAAPSLDGHPTATQPPQPPPGA